jgi:Ca-activated chloride channel family protein
VAWKGPNNSGDYITIVPKEMPDGQYANYTVTSNGSPLKLLTPIMEGSAELRYMTGQGGKVLARRPITIVTAKVSLSAPAECAAGSDVSITWTGPNNPGDYITVVAKGTPDGQYGAYTVTSEGSPLKVKAPKKRAMGRSGTCPGRGQGLGTGGDQDHAMTKSRRFCRGVRRSAGQAPG